MSGIDVDAVDGAVRIRVRVGEKTATLRVTHEYASNLARELMLAAGKSDADVRAAENIANVFAKAMGKMGL